MENIKWPLVSKPTRSCSASKLISCFLAMNGNGILSKNNKHENLHNPGFECRTLVLKLQSLNHKRHLGIVKNRNSIRYQVYFGRQLSYDDNNESRHCVIEQHSRSLGQ